MVKSYLDISGENSDLSSSIYAFFDKDRYFFDCGEGSQRVYKERSSIKISKIKTIFVSSLSWESIGGIFGVCYLLIGIEECKEVNIYGPPGLYNVFYHSREFLNLDIKVNIYEMNEFSSQELKMEQLKVTTIPIHKNNNNNNKDSNDKTTPYKMTCYHNYMEIEQWEALVKATREERKTMYVNVKPIDADRIVIDKDTILCFKGETNQLQGRFYPDRAIALGVPKGPSFHALSSGKSVTTKDGTVVTPEQVMDPPQPGTKFAIIRCPSIEYVDSLLESDFKNKEFTNGLHFVIHITPSNVLESEKYQAFIKYFNSSTASSEDKDSIKHIIVNNENCKDYKQFLASEREVEKLRYFLPSIFGSPCEERPLKTLSDELVNQHSKHHHNHLTCCEKVTRVGLAPPSEAGIVKFLNMEDEITEDKTESKVFDELINNKSEKARVLKEKIAALSEQYESQSDKKQYPRVLFTGTGAAKPSKTRNVTGHLVETVEGQYLLMDCGEGTYNQLLRFFGVNKVNEILKNIQLIWISHSHADHHLGTPLMLEKINQAKRGLNLPEVLLIAPADIVDWLQGLSTITHSNHIGFSFDKQDKLIDECYSRLGIRSWVNAHVDHCDDARGAIIVFEDGNFKLSYSGDTRPSDEFITAGLGSNFMIHEATFEDTDQKDAVEKKHSTIGEALTVGLKMNAQTSVCTHFSQKTKCLTNIDENVVKPDSYGYSFDFLYISPYQYPLFKCLIELINLEEEIKLQIK